jgi:hypothetical protein
MTTPRPHGMFSVAWIAVVALICFAIEPGTLRSWIYLTVLAVLPPLLVMRLWSAGPDQTVGELLYATETRR